MLDLSIYCVPGPHLHTSSLPIDLDVSCSARPYLHMPGLPNPTSCERRLICVTPDMYGCRPYGRSFQAVPTKGEHIVGIMRDGPICAIIDISSILAETGSKT